MAFKPTKEQPTRPNRSAILADLWRKGEKPPEKETPAWFALVDELENEQARPICAAVRRNRQQPQVNGWPCLRSPKKNGRCQKHGGNQPAPGPEHPNWKTGRYSDVLKGTSLYDSYAKALRDPTLVSLTEEIAVLAAKLKDSLTELLSGESFHVWLTTADRVQRVKMLIDAGKTGQAYSQLDTLEKIVRESVRTAEAWNDWTTHVEVLRKLVDTERKNRTEKSLSVSVERMMAIMTMWTTAASNVLPPEYAAALKAEVSRLRHADGPSNFSKEIINLSGKVAEA
jgi:hypothetical protein